MAEKRKVVYKEPTDYIPKSIAKEFGLFDEPKKKKATAPKKKTTTKKK